MTHAQRVRRFVGALAIAIVPASVRAEAARWRVVLAGGDGLDAAQSEVIARIRGELSAGGFVVMSLDGKVDPAIDPSEPGPVAVARLKPEAGGMVVEVWIYNRATHRAYVRHIRGARSGEGSSVLAVRAAEAVRAGLLVLNPSMERAQFAEAAAPPDVARVIGAESAVDGASRTDAATRESRSKSVSAYLGISGLGSFDGMGLGWGPNVGVSRGLGGAYVGRFDLSLVEFGVNLDESIGTATVRQDLALVSIARRLSSQISHVDPYAWAGIGVYHMQASGQASLPRMARTEHAWSFAAAAGLGMSVRVVDRIALFADGGLVMLQPRVVVTMAGQPVARTGWPAALLTGGVTYQW